MLSQSAEYALRAIIYLAANQGSPRTTDEIASVTRVPTSYLSKILQALTRARLVNSQRGVRGGFMVARPADSITVLEAISAVDAHQKLRFAAKQLQSPTEASEELLTPLHQLLEESFKTVERTFQETTIDALILQPVQEECGNETETVEEAIHVTAVTSESLQLVEAV